MIRNGSVRVFLPRGGGHILPPSQPLYGGFISVQAISWVIEHSQHKGNSFVVLMMIANHAKSDGTGAWPSVPTLAREARVSERTVQRCIHRLSRKWSGVKNWHGATPDLKVLVGKGPHGSNLYDIPGVKLSPGGRQFVAGVVSDTVTRVVSPVSPEPSLTVLKDKERPRAQSSADFPSRALAEIPEEEWQRHLDKIDPKRKRA
jgi:Helix-turn-helix domain